MGQSVRFSNEYFSPGHPGSLGGVNRLVRASKRRREEVRDWLKKLDTFTLHKPIRQKFRRMRVVVAGIDSQWQADLVDVVKLSRFNNGFKYLLTLIDVFSKYAWVVPIKNKTGSSLVEAFEKILKDGNRHPAKLQTDRGKEFVNKLFQNWLKKQKIEFFTTFNDETKASVVERFNRTLKDRLWRHFTHTSKSRYIDILDQVVESYNNSYHRSIKTTPSSVNTGNEERVWESLYGATSPPVKSWKFKVGDPVRIAVTRAKFKKGYLPNWSKEIFYVKSRRRTTPHTYTLIDYNDERIEGSFYEQELQIVEKELFTIERVIQRRKRRGMSQLLIKWADYPDSFNSWVDAKDVVHQRH